MSKLKVALTKVSHLAPFQGLALKHSAVDPRTIAEKFYLKTLPRMTTMPRTADSAPRVNLWLWLIGYVRIQWPEVERKSRKVFGVHFPAKLTLLLENAHKLLPEKLRKVSRQNPGFLKSVIEDGSVTHTTKKWGNR